MNQTHHPHVVEVRNHNDVMQTLVSLRSNRRQRTARREFVVEGVRSINTAVRCGWQINAFVYGADRQFSGWAKELLANERVRDHVVLSDALMRQFSERSETSELIAIVAIPADDPARISARVDGSRGEGSAPLVVLLDRPASPGNLGSVIRSCDAFGAHGVLVTGHATDIYDPECVRASTGSLFSVPVIRIHQRRLLDEWLTTFRSQWPSLQCVGTDENGSLRLDARDFEQPTLVLLGNETRGLSAAYRATCDALVRIPMQGAASSLNVACAASIVLYEIDRQRAHNSARPYRT